MKQPQEVLWAARTRAEFADWAARGAVVVLPIGAVEQHGLHLPVGTDCVTAEQIACRAACLADDAPVLVAPLIPYGISPHHMMHGGTITLRVETLLRLLDDACTGIAAHGFRRILILSGHGGNRNTIGASALELSHRLGCRIEAHCWFDLIPAALDEVREGPEPSIGHAGELETSVMLDLEPGAVRCDRLTPVVGLTDDPALAGEVKGRRIVQAGVEAVAQLLRAMAAAPGKAKTFAPPGME